MINPKHVRAFIAGYPQGCSPMLNFRDKFSMSLQDADNDKFNIICDVEEKLLTKYRTNQQGYCYENVTMPNVIKVIIKHGTLALVCVFDFE
jgi:hypothetical protein